MKNTAFKFHRETKMDQQLGIKKGINNQSNADAPEEKMSFFEQMKKN